MWRSYKYNISRSQAWTDLIVTSVTWAQDPTCVWWSSTEVIGGHEVWKHFKSDTVSHEVNVDGMSNWKHLLLLMSRSFLLCFSVKFKGHLVAVEVIVWKHKHVISRRCLNLKFGVKVVLCLSWKFAINHYFKSFNSLIAQVIIYQITLFQ